MQQIVVKKFGGTSVGSPENMNRVFDIVTNDATPRKIVVLSALSGTTNSLVQIQNCIYAYEQKQALQLLEQLKRYYRNFVVSLLKNQEQASHTFNYLEASFFDKIETLVTDCSQGKEKELLAMGEQMSTYLFSILLSQKEINHQLTNALEFIHIDENETPKFDAIKQNFNRLLLEYDTDLFVTQGFICSNPEGMIDNLKRGGSDYTASIIAASVGASCCEIWTDIDGMHNNDPRYVEHTSPIKQLCFEEASELAYFGAKVLHPTCILPAQSESIPVKILNTINPTASGTTISNAQLIQGEKAIAAKDDIVVIRIKSSSMLMAYGFLTKIFSVFEKYKTPIDMITTSEIAISLTIDNTSQLEHIEKELKHMGTIEVEENQTIICVVGYNVIESTTLLKKIFVSLDSIPIRMISHGGSRNNVSVLINSRYKLEVLQKLNNALF